MTVHKENGNPRIKIIRDGGHLIHLYTTKTWFYESQT